MGIDKMKAMGGGWRISEKTLFIFAVLGGAAACIAGTVVFRHKIGHMKFVIGMPAIVLLHIVIFVLLRKAGLS